MQITGDDQSTSLNPENIPDKIVLIDEKNVPDLYNYGVALSWVAFIGAFGAIALIAYPYFRDRKVYLQIMLTQSFMLVVVGLIALLLGPLFRPIVLEPFQNVNGRTVVANLYDAFIATFNSQTMILIYIGLLVLVVTFSIWMYPTVRKLIKK